ncbi:RNA polymerase II C-terminal domain phosphatase-like 3 isoform X1 [Iris pallida]|uniref:protein-serine/threonine phosphatase n=1 Tax=Iris pallida TaxID=29817 RepID=A0AAX6H8Z5_IRIPA|nr:RNA polymerase II C-terminal domain phosphatase-like 3 isoform X1 [Iris pallida]
MRRREGSGTDGGSDSSLEEISADDFRPRKSGVWMGYPSIPRSFGQDLYSFAWAQAVQNKPLGFDVKPAKKDEEEMVFVVDDDDEVGGEEMEKEEGELEEGEIELASESVTNDGAVKIEITNCEKKENDNEEDEEVVIIGEFDQSVGTILEELEAITVEEAEAAFEAVCSRLQKLFASLKKMYSESAGVPVLDALVQQAFMGIQTVYGVYSLGNLKKMEQNRDLLLRLLIHIKNQYSVFLSAEQVKEIDERVQALASESVNVEKPGHVGNLNGFTNAVGLVPATKAGLDYRTVDRGSSNNSKAALPKLEQSINTRKFEFSPLLNLHADYDEDSLPSPTRDNAPPLPTLRPIGFDTEIVAQPAQPIPPKNVEAGNGSVHPYVADAFKEVSSYQQKYGRNSILTSNRLPSPTPSEDGNDEGDDSHNEVSSSSVGNNVRTVGFSSTRANINSSSGSQIPPAKPVDQMGLGPNAVIKTSAKSRDPRLRFMNVEVGGAPQNGVGGSENSRKKKAGEEALADGNTLKRQRNGLSRDLQVTAGTGGRIEDGGPLTSQMGNRIRPNENVSMEIRKPGNGVNANMNSKESTGVNAKVKSKESNSGSVPKPAASPAPSVSLPSLLKDIAVNPTMLLQLVKREQQRLAAEAQQKTANPKLAADSQPKNANLAVNGLPVAVPSANNAPTNPLEVAQNPVMKPQISSQSTSMNAQNDVGKIRMKARDPRRILHTNMVQKTDTLGSEPPKTSGALVSDVQNNKDRITVHEQGEQIQTTSLASQSTPLPDIAWQFTKNLKNVADIVSTSESTAPLPAALQNISQPVPSKITDDSSDLSTFSGTSSQGGGTGGSSQSSSQSVNPWGDVDHLLDGYDDQQRAAIQKERARRIAEQNKMFSEKKLCLVLDLDHTLLNSAKFIEVDPVHEEILRIKEEQDREKPERHLFRFQHMGMWTKLRPGVWKFLEKASKLFELHLYTMGNKLYATEMAKVLDPTGALFAGRVISKGDDGDPLDGDDRIPKSKDLEGVLGMESAVVIIDDSVRVWPHHKLNLIVVERYTYFPCSRRQFGLPGPSLLEIDHDERPEEATLASASGVIERIHHNFFSHRSLNEVDVRNILASEQRKILAGCKIVFSRVFPVGEANPHLHPLWQTAEQFGAECTNQIDEKVTHVVANSLGTDKVNWALSTGRFVVHPGWVEASALLYRRASEQDFAVKL